MSYIYKIYMYIYVLYIYIYIYISTSNVLEFSLIFKASLPSIYSEIYNTLQTLKKSVL